MEAQIIPWFDPLLLGDALNAAGDNEWAMLYSATPTSYSGQYSYVVHKVKNCIESNNFDALEAALASYPEDTYIGYIGYDAKNGLERLTKDKELWITQPDIRLVSYQNTYIFDHINQKVKLIGDTDIHLSITQKPMSNIPIECINITSNMSKSSYLGHVATILENIQQGNVYQANLTRKFYGEFKYKTDTYDIFKRLCTASPACYANYIHFGDNAIISSSPERFLKISKAADGTHHVTSRPIKGTIARGDTEEKDNNNKDILLNSAKDKAENLMIVDLMRNDISKCAHSGSVHVSALFEITTHALIHHMSSTIEGTLAPKCHAIDMVKACFPPGSMTGTPKISAMELCSQLEKYRRGVYSGTIGWINANGECDLSVVIRTIITQNNRFEFQVGGAIVADSVPALEWEESLCKAKGLCLALNIDEAHIANL